MDTDAPSAMSVAARRAIIGSIAISIAFVIELTLVPMVLPSIQAEFGLDIGQLAWVFNSYGIAVAVGVLLGGWLGDMFGVRKIFTAGVLMFASGSIAVAFASSYETIIAGRVLQGFGGGVFSPLVPLLLTRAVPNRPGKILIIWGSVAGYVAAFAPLALGQTIAVAGWQSIFVLFAVISLVALAINGRMKAGANQQINNVPPNIGTMLKTPRLWLVYVYIFCTYGAITFYLFRLPLWLSENEFNVTVIGFVLAMVWLSFSISGTLLRNLVDGVRVRGIILSAPVLIAASFPVAYMADSVAGFTLSAALVGIGFACSNAPSTQMVLRFAPQGMSAFSASMDITFARLGGVTTVTALAHAQFANSITAVIAMSLVATFCALVFAKAETRSYTE